MHTPRVVVFDERIADLSIERAVFDDVAVDLTLADGISPERVATEASDAFGIIVDANVPVPASVIERLDDLRIVARSGIGFDNIDLEAAADRDIRVTNVPDYCLEEVSTHALALLLTLARKVHVYDRATSDGRWEWSDGVRIDRLSHQTLGLVGVGNIGRRMAAKATPIFDDLVAYDPYVPAEELRSSGVDPVSFETLLARSDVVSLHPPLTDETTGMIDAAALETMGEGTILVNTSRGEVIDQDALESALDDGTIAAAGLDVLETEPPVDESLLSRDDVVATPHSAWYSEDSLVELRQSAAEEVKRTIEDREPRNPVSENEWQ
ncbi:MAG: C-terminal binding protein [Halobacteriota archaeon]